MYWPRSPDKEFWTAVVPAAAVTRVALTVAALPRPIVQGDFKLVSSGREIGDGVKCGSEED